MSDQAVLYDLRDEVAYMTLNRPEASNAVDLDFARVFADVVSRVAFDGPRAVLIEGRGKRFCAGSCAPDYQCMISSPIWWTNAFNFSGRSRVRVAIPSATS
jgi:hypothetical protein